MDICNSLENFQEKMNKMFCGIEFIGAYIDDLLITSKGDWSDHFNKLQWVLQKLKDNRLKCNIDKSFSEQTQMEYLGFWVTRNGICPVNKKVESMVNMIPPKNIIQVRAFVGLVIYYRDMWARW